MLTPWALRADLRRRPWGGDRLAGRWARGEADVEPGSEPVGEAWLAGPWTRVAAGPDAGRDLAALAAEHGSALLGAVPWSRYGARFPLLVKLLDAAEPLSLQVHPDDAYALRFESASGHLGKTEAWWVLAADPGAQVTWGFAHEVTTREVERAAEGGHWAPLLRQLPVVAGDVIVNPAGTVHALGAGLLVYEVQQASDLTYRLYDHGRLGADGRPRELHLDRALAVARLTPGPAPAPTAVARAAGRVELARTDAFVLEAVDPRAEGVAASGVAWEVGTTSFELLTDLGDAGLAGVGTLRWDGGETRMAAGSSWLLPAGLGPVTVRGPSRCARCWVPHPPGAP